MIKSKTLINLILSLCLIFFTVIIFHELFMFIYVALKN